MNAPVTNWGWSASWYDNVDFDENWNSPLGFSVEFDGNIDTFVASGAREGNVEVEGSVGTMLLGFPSYVGSGITPGMENFKVSVEGDLGYLAGQRLSNVQIEIEGDLGDARLSRSSYTDIYVDGDTGNFSVSGSFAVSADFNGDVGAYRSVNSFFNDVHIGGEVDMLVDRGGIMNSYSVDTVDVAKFIGGGFNFLAADELDQLLQVRDSVASTFYIGETDDRARIRLEGGESNYLEVAEAGDKLVITTIGGQGNTVRIGEGSAAFNIMLTEAATSYSPNITALGGTGEDTFTVSGKTDVGVADVEGGGGSDTFIFAGGTTHAHGGEGPDSFVFMGGVAHIEDFVVGEDKLQIDAAGPVSVNMYYNDDGTLTFWLSDQGLLG